MGGLAQLFTGGGYSAPEPVKSEPLPDRSTVEPESAAAREEERRKLRARRSMSGTLLTSPLGASGNATSLLGRSQ